MLGGYGTFPISCKDLDQIILESCDNAFIFAKWEVMNVYFAYKVVLIKRCFARKIQTKMENNLQLC